MKSFRGIKMLAAQDEYDDPNGKLKLGMQQIAITCSLRTQSGQMIEKLYPRRGSS